MSIAAGVAALTSAFPALHVSRVELSLVFMAVLTVGNLRGIRESGRIFSVPDLFLRRRHPGAARRRRVALRHRDDRPASTGPLRPRCRSDRSALFAILTAFANGCTAMTGVEAVSNGVPGVPAAGEQERGGDARRDGGARRRHVHRHHAAGARLRQSCRTTPRPCVSQIARAVFGGRGWPYYAIQAGTMLILVLAANTAYADFPRLASIVSRDRYLPRQFMNQGDRLAFSNGIVVLSVCAGLLLVVFGGDTHALIPLYMIGVFVSFTLSQSGMVIHWRRMREPGWRTSAVINGFGAHRDGDRARHRRDARRRSRARGSSSC